MPDSREQAIERGKAKGAKAASAKPGKSGKSGKSKGSAKGKKGAPAEAGTSVATHPRGRRAVRRAKGLGGLLGFALAALLSHRAGLAPAGLLERALITGVVGYLLAGACAVGVWRHLLVAEQRAAYEAYRRRTAPPAPGADPSAAPSRPATPAS